MNGQEKEDALFAGAQSAEDWMYDSRIGRRWELDPITYEEQSPYATFNNNPIHFSDPDGLEGESDGDGDKGKGKGGSDLKNGGVNGTTLNEPSAADKAKVEGSSPITPEYLNSKTIKQLPKTETEQNLSSSSSNSQGYPTFEQAPPAMYKQPAWITNTRSFLHGIEQFNPVSQGWDAMSHLMFGTDKYGNKTNGTDFTYAAIGSIPFVGAESGLSKNLVKNVAKQEAKYTVYQGLDNNGAIKYIGITSRNPATRFLEHLSAVGTGRELLQYRIMQDVTNVNKINARIIEQNLINYYGLQKNGGQLLNKINSISPKNWAKYGILQK